MNLDWSALTAVLSGVVALGGVYLGARLSRRNADDQWRREQRLKTYTEVLAALRSVNSQFATSVRVSHLNADSARESGHDFEGTEWRWLDSFAEIERLEDSLALVGGRGRFVYDQEVNPLLADYWDALDEPDADEWDALVDRGSRVLEKVSDAFRRDLGEARRPRS